MRGPFGIIFIAFIVFLLFKTTIPCLITIGKARNAQSNPCNQSVESLMSGLSSMWCGMIKYPPFFYSNMRNAYMILNETKEVSREEMERLKSLYIKKGISLPTTKIYKYYN